MSEVVFLKLGGSLLTDKTQPDTLRPGVLPRLAAEIAGALAAAAAPRLVLGHGSGSFGHQAAARYHLAQGLTAPEQRLGVHLTRERVVALHQLVLAALAEAGLAPFSIAPSSALVTRARAVAACHVEPVRLALAAGLLPVTFGDVVMDSKQGVAIASTETVLRALAEELEPQRVLWAGVTDGVWGPGGQPLREISAADAAAALETAGPAVGTDVTGGMAHRLYAALELARRGVPSLIFDATVPGRLAAALAGEPVPGTRVRP